MWGFYKRVILTNLKYINQSPIGEVQVFLINIHITRAAYTSDNHKQYSFYWRPTSQADCWSFKRVSDKKKKKMWHKWYTVALLSTLHQNETYMQHTCNVNKTLLSHPNNNSRFCLREAKPSKLQSHNKAYMFCNCAKIYSLGRHHS